MTKTLEGKANTQQKEVIDVTFKLLNNNIFKSTFSMLLMEVKVLKEAKDELTVQFDNLTIAEILRVYLNQDDNVKFAAWRREHPSKPPILNIKTQGKTAKKAFQDAIAKIEKDADKAAAELKKTK